MDWLGLRIPTTFELDCDPQEWSNGVVYRIG